MTRMIVVAALLATLSGAAGAQTVTPEMLKAARDEISTITAEQSSTVAECGDDCLTRIYRAMRAREPHDR